jgi:diaminopimelate epimerase
MNIVKAHAFGNDFLLAARGDVPPGTELPSLARRLCERHRGLGADGLIVHDGSRGRASMQLLNADGSYSEISGNGVRCLAAAMARDARLPAGGSLIIETDAGAKTLELLDVAAGRYTFRAAMGQPERIERVAIPIGDDDVEAVTMRVGNPQCVVLGEVTDERLRTVAAALAVHPRFPEGTNVELAHVEAPGRVRILIWERGVGPTEASGTGACAAAVAAIRYGGASPDVEIESPGGTQRVEWRDDGLYLTGWAEVLVEGRWILDDARM